MKIFVPEISFQHNAAGELAFPIPAPFFEIDPKEVQNAPEAFRRYFTERHADRPLAFGRVVELTRERLAKFPVNPFVSIDGWLCGLGPLPVWFESYSRLVATCMASPVPEEREQDAEFFDNLLLRVCVYLTKYTSAKMARKKGDMLAFTTLRSVSI